MNWTGKHLSTKVRTKLYLHCSHLIFRCCVTALLLFATRIEQNSIVYLTDNTGTDIPRNLFEIIIKNYWNGSNFYVEIKYTPTTVSNVELVTREVWNIFMFDV